ncbi:dynamin family protein [Neobacillus vireti]|uniref:dynamin family protein n=1 Tax=Neobacillus vireti TaxID=220686 RepID=UPI002FFE286B
MNEIEYAKKIEQILTSDHVTRNYFQNFTIDLQSRLERWQDQTIRIGLIGVTSSGKSTLLNALLGDNILPTAVRPSSGSIIICSKGPTTSAEIVFENGRNEKVGEQHVAAVLKKYGDEAENTNNRYRVKEIHLQSKNFVLQKEVQIIDSPGLDAYGLERHEELTLSTLLPTIDLCLYVVTLKTNSDDTTHRILDQIYQQHKPMIIVQNMLDSIEPKLGKNGRIEKTREQIAEEHFNRTKRILDTIDPKLHELVQIVQVSAKRAVDGRRQGSKEKVKESQIENLVHMIQSYREKIGPQLFRTRGNGLKSLIDAIVKEEEKLSGNKETFDREIQQLEQELEEQLSSLDKSREGVRSKKNELESTLDRFQREVASYQRRIDGLSKSDLVEAKSILSDMKSKSSQVEEQFLSSMKTMNLDVTSFLSTLGFDLSEMIRSISSRSSSTLSRQYFDLKSTTETKSRQVKSSGAFGGAKRFFGSIFKKDWGYETVYDKVEVLDKTAIKRNLQDFEQNFSQALSQKLQEWELQLQRAMTEMQNIQKQKRAALQDKKKYRDELKNIELIIQQLQELRNSLDSNLKKNDRIIQKHALKMRNEKAIVLSGKMVKVEVNAETYHLYEMSRTILQTLFSKCLEHVEQLNSKNQSHQLTIVLGWDDLSLAQFMQRYFQMPLTNAEQVQLVKDGLLVKGNCRIVYEMRLSEQNRQQLKQIMEKGQFNMYVLVNIVQAGQAKSQLMRSHVLKVPQARQSVCNLVTQSFKEFIENGAYDEAVELLDDMKHLPLFQRGEIIINDSSPLFTIMHLQLDHSNAVVHDSTQLTKYIQNKLPFLIESGRMSYAYNQYLNAIMKRTGVKLNGEVVNHRN